MGQLLLTKGVNPTVGLSTTNPTRIPTPKPCPKPSINPGGRVRVVSRCPVALYCGTNSRSKAVRPVPLTVIPTGNPTAGWSPRLVVWPPECVTSGRTKPICPPTVGPFFACACSCDTLLSCVCGVLLTCACACGALLSCACSCGELLSCACACGALLS